MVFRHIVLNKRRELFREELSSDSNVRCIPPEHWRWRLKTSLSKRASCKGDKKCICCQSIYKQDNKQCKIGVVYFLLTLSRELDFKLGTKVWKEPRDVTSVQSSRHGAGKFSSHPPSLYVLLQCVDIVNFTWTLSILLTIWIDISFHTIFWFSLRWRLPACSHTGVLNQ